MYQTAADAIRKRLKTSPKIGVVLGSGLGSLAEEVKDRTEIPYGEIPGFQVSTVPGHAGRLVGGSFAGKDVLMMQGRLHFYEGHSVKDLVFPIRVMKLLGVETLILTNACGGVNKHFQAGDFMIISDYINYAGQNPLIGPNEDSFGPRFPDMSETFNPALRALARRVSDQEGIEIKEGTYMWFTGPTFETPAEIRMASVLGADAVGMSTVPEAIAAHHCGIKVLGISCVTNMAAGLQAQKLSHEEVNETAARVKPLFEKLIRGIVSQI